MPPHFREACATWLTKAAFDGITLQKMGRVRLLFALSPPRQAFHVRKAEGKLAFETAKCAVIDHDNGAALDRIAEIGFECQPTTARARTRDHKQADNSGDVLFENGVAPSPSCSHSSRSSP
jgi:hypothetical protein